MYIHVHCMLLKNGGGLFLGGYSINKQTSTHSVHVARSSSVSSLERYCGTILWNAKSEHTTIQIHRILRYRTKTQCMSGVTNLE